MIFEKEFSKGVNLNLMVYLWVFLLTIASRIIVTKNRAIFEYKRIYWLIFS